MHCKPCSSNSISEFGVAMDFSSFRYCNYDRKTWSIIIDWLALAATPFSHMVADGFAIIAVQGMLHLNEQSDSKIDVLHLKHIILPTELLIAQARKPGV